MMVCPTLGRRHSWRRSPPEQRSARDPVRRLHGAPPGSPRQRRSGGGPVRTGASRPSSRRSPSAGPSTRAMPRSTSDRRSPPRRVRGRPSAASARFTSSNSTSSRAGAAITSSSAERSSRSRTKRARASPTSGRFWLPSRRRRRPFGVVTIRPRISGTPTIVRGVASTASSRTWTSTPQAWAVSVIRSRTAWVMAQPSTRRLSRIPRIAMPPSVMAIAARRRPLALGTPAPTWRAAAAPTAGCR